MRMIPSLRRLLEANNALPPPRPFGYLAVTYIKTIFLLRTQRFCFTLTLRYLGRASFYLQIKRSLGNPRACIGGDCGLSLQLPLRYGSWPLSPTDPIPLRRLHYQYFPQFQANGDLHERSLSILSR